MMRKLSTWSWRYVFWRAEHDFGITLAKRVFPGLLLVLFFITALFAVLPQTSEFELLQAATSWLTMYLYLHCYGDYVYKLLRHTYVPKYRIRYNWALCSLMNWGDAE